MQRLQEGIMEKEILRQRLAWPLACGVALAYARSPEEALDVLEQWKERAISLGDPAPESPPSRREWLLGSVALCYGALPVTSDSDSLSFNPLNALRALLHDETHRSVRHDALFGVGRLFLSDPARTEAGIRDLLQEILLEDRPTALYVFETLDNLERNRPMSTSPDLQMKTEIERTMSRWELDSDHQVAAQIALEFRDRLGARRKKGKPLDEKPPTTAGLVDRRGRRIHSAGLLGWFAAVFVTIRHWNRHAAVRLHLGELIHIMKADLNPPDSKWHETRFPTKLIEPRVTVDDLELSDLLRRAFRLYQCRWWGMAGFGILLTSLFVIGVFSGWF
jgi:hypothetical protein